MISYFLLVKKYLSYLTTFGMILAMLILLVFNLQTGSLGDENSVAAQANAKDAAHESADTLSGEDEAAQANAKDAAHEPADKLSEKEEAAQANAKDAAHEPADKLSEEEIKAQDNTKNGQPKSESHGGGSHRISVFQNNNPMIIEFKFNKCAQVGKENYSCYLEDNLYISYKVTDQENNGIICNISSNDSSSFNISRNALSYSVPYFAASSGIFEFNLSVTDRDCGENNSKIYLDVKPKTYKEHFSETFPPQIKEITLIVILLLLILKSILYMLHKRAICANLLTGSNKVKLWNAIKYIIILIFILFVYYTCNEKLNFLDYVYYIYLLVLLFSICFIELIFSFSNQRRIFGSPPLDLDLWQLSVPTPNSPMIEDFAALSEMTNQNQNFEKFFNYLKEFLRYLKESILTFVMILGMCIAILIVGVRVPLDFVNVEPDTRYSFIFYYYSSIIQLFGTILSIVAMFTIWHLQERDHLWNKSEIIIKIKNFMFLYISIIIICIGGLALVKYPLLDVLSEIGPLAVSGPIIAFEVSILLIIPAMAALFRLACWLMDFDHNNNH
jgi:hypothetical protein